MDRWMDGGREGGRRDRGMKGGQDRWRDGKMNRWREE